MDSLRNATSRERKPKVGNQSQEVVVVHNVLPDHLSLPVMGFKGGEVGAGIIGDRAEVGDADAEPTLPAHVFTVGRGVIS